MKQIYLLSFLTLLFIFQGCSSKQYYEPQDTKSMDIEVEDIDSDIIDYNSDGATLENGKFISKDGISAIVLDENYKFLNNSNGTILSADDNGSMSINTKETNELISLSANI